MDINVLDIDGFYRIESETDDKASFSPNGDGVTEIKNGLTFRKDNNGCIWESLFTVAGDDKVQLETTVDPSHTPPGYYISDENGQPTKGIVVYKSMLDLSEKDGRIVMSGTVTHGKITTKLTFTRISAEEAKAARKKR